MATDGLNQADPGKLARLLALNAVAKTDSCWDADEFAAVWQHQLSTPVQAEAGYSCSAPAPPSSRSGQESAVITVGELLNQARPSLQLLEQLRVFAKAAGGEPTPLLPREMAHVLYFASIAAGLVRHGERLTALDDNSLRRGFDWSTAQGWIDSDTRDLFSQALTNLAGRGDEVVTCP